MAEGFGLPCPPPDPEEDDISDSSLDDDFAPKNLDGLLIVSTTLCVIMKKCLASCNLAILSLFH